MEILLKAIPHENVLKSVSIANGWGFDLHEATNSVRFLDVASFVGLAGG